MSAGPAWIAEQVENGWLGRFVQSMTLPKENELAYRNSGRSSGRSNSDKPKKVLAIAGRVGSEPEYREAGDTEVLEFRLAMTTSYEEGADAKWFDVTVWNEGLQQSVESEIYKGAAVAVEGVYSEREYEGKIYPKISASRVGLVEYLSRDGKAPSSRSSSKSKPAPKSSRRQEPVEDELDDDLPF